MIKLKPCPFCGNTNPVYWCYTADAEHLFTDRWSVLCFYSDGGCGAEGSHEKSKEEAAIAWNERTPNIVRCKDCKWFEMPRFGERGFCKSMEIVRETTSFCSDGEAKE